MNFSLTEVFALSNPDSVLRVYTIFFYIVHFGGIFLGTILLLSDKFQGIREKIIKSKILNSKIKYNVSKSKIKNRIYIYFNEYILKHLIDFSNKFLWFVRNSLECNICFVFWINFLWYCLIFEIYMKTIDFILVISLSFFGAVCSISLYLLLKLIEVFILKGKNGK
ncbi:MAG: hypothetical protein KatS3mg068_1537 [Candidatus Sericytochromatia bacterium]|nr:MAG: hypothetical protein KatS3mg068_1537 [Candidatus Sericytochromatia bacterium]